jgi:hypothetical protein
VKREDYERAPCACGDCHQAGVSHLNQRRDPFSGKWLCGYELKRLYNAKEACLAMAKQLAAKKGMR